VPGAHHKSSTFLPHDVVVPLPSSGDQNSPPTEVPNVNLVDRVEVCAAAPRHMLDGEDGVRGLLDDTEGRTAGGDQILHHVPPLLALGSNVLDLVMLEPPLDNPEAAVVERRAAASISRDNHLVHLAASVIKSEND